MNIAASSLDADPLAFPHPLPDLPAGYPNGWMPARDLHVLYNLARRTTGPVLEVGPWLGRSSTAIAAGLAAREAESLPRQPYDLVDFGITSAEEWEMRFGAKLNFGKDKGRVAEAIYHPGGTLAVLIRNLKDNGLLAQTTSIIRGDFHDLPLSRRYGLIFCDATHDDAEIHRHLPKIAELAAPGATLVFDDVVTEDRADLICGYLAADRRMMTRPGDTRRARQKLLVVTTRG